MNAASDRDQIKSPLCALTGRRSDGGGSPLLLASVLLLAACAGSPSLTRGLPSSGLTAEQRAQAEEQLEGALALEGEGRFEEAAIAYRRLWELHPLPRFLILAARADDQRAASCQVRRRAWRSAADACASCPFQSKIQEKLSEIEGCGATVRFESTPPGAQITLAGRAIGQTPFAHDLAPGEYQVSARRGGAEQQARLVVSEEDTQLHFAFSASGTRPRGAERGREPGARAAVFTATLPARRDDGSQRALYNLQVKLFCESREPASGRYQPLSQCQQQPLWEDDRFRVELSTNHSAWVYLVLQNQRGQRQLLFPRRGEAHQSSPGAQLQLPARQWYVMDEIGPVEERLLVIASPTPIDTLEGLQEIEIPTHSSEEIIQALSRGVRFESSDERVEPASLRGEQVTLRRGRGESLWLELRLDHRGRRGQESNL